MRLSKSDLEFLKEHPDEASWLKGHIEPQFWLSFESQRDNISIQRYRPFLKAKQDLPFHDSEGPVPSATLPIQGQSVDLERLIATIPRDGSIL
jgi:hypothetical protein